MSHNVDTMTFAGQLPWWGIGQNLKPGDEVHDRFGEGATGRFLGEEGTLVRGAEMLRAAGLDFEVGLVPASFLLGDELRTVPGRFAVVRKDTGEAFDVVGSKYVPVQNAELFAIPDLLVEEGHVTYETAGSLRQGRIVWALANLRVGEVVRMNGAKERLDQYMLWYARHDGHSSVIGGTTHVRVVCNNTLDAAGGKNGQNLGKRVRIRHTRSAAGRIAEAHARILELREDAEQVCREAQDMARRAMNGADFRAFAGTWLDDVRGQVADPKTAEEEEEAARLQAALDKRGKVVDELEGLFRGGTGNSGESLWDGYNAVTEWLDHRRTRYQKESARQQHLQNTVLDGITMKQKARALQLLRK